MRNADRILFGADLAPDPEMYAIHYRFLETFDESFDYGTEEPPSQGRWQIHGIGLPDDVLRGFISGPTGGKRRAAAPRDRGIANRIRIHHRRPNVFGRDTQHFGRLHGDRRSRAADIG